MIPAMVDHVSPERRSGIMRAVRGKNSGPEILVRKAAYRLGLRFRLHVKRLPGTPDLVFRKWRTAVFVNGCFWHRHHGCKKSSFPKTNGEFWRKKFSDNVHRDATNYRRLTALGWKVVVLWQCQVRTVDEAVVLLRQHFENDLA
jgi:DNA mismatch endonuclease (patch repair protein)